ncbi:MAG TPA: cation:proton antiporter, partial [Ohtaekwangia sp.]|nr:cation:proton antiporter [Ohtaekwangia sp.]
MIKLSQHEVTMLLIQLGIMLITGRVFAEFARAVRQPGVVGEILAGIVLGPTVFGMFFPELFNTVFGTGNSALVLDGIVQVAVVMLLFIAGLEVDLNIVIRQGRQALLTSSFGLVIPFVLGAALPFLMPELLSVDEDKDLVPFALFMGTSMAITALPVIA